MKPSKRKKGSKMDAKQAKEELQRLLDNPQTYGVYNKVADAFTFAITAIDELEELTVDHRRIMDEPCCETERHCTCVPMYRKENARLKDRVGELNEEIVQLKAELERLEERM